MMTDIIVLGLLFLISWLKERNGFIPIRKELRYDAEESFSRLSTITKFIKAIVPIICIMMYFIWGMVCFYKGYRENSDFMYITECGKKVTANVVEQIGEREIIDFKETRQYIYLVEFVIDGEKRQGRMLTTEYFLHSGDDVCIYYLTSSPGKVADVAIDDTTFYPGNNMITRGIGRWGTGFFIYILLKEILE